MADRRFYPTRSRKSRVEQRLERKDLTQSEEYNFEPSPAKVRRVSSPRKLVIPRPKTAGAKGGQVNRKRKLNYEKNRDELDALLDQSSSSQESETAVTIDANDETFHEIELDVDPEEGSDSRPVTSTPRSGTSSSDSDSFHSHLISPISDHQDEGRHTCKHFLDQICQSSADTDIVRFIFLGFYHSFQKAAVLLTLRTLGLVRQSNQRQRSGTSRITLKTQNIQMTGVKAGCGFRKIDLHP